MRVFFVAMTAMLLVLVPQDARAQYTLSVAGIDPGPAPTDRAACLGEHLRRQVSLAPGYDLIPGKDIDEIKLLFGCEDLAPECMAKAGQSMQVEKLLWGRLESGRSGYVLIVILLDVSSGRVEKSAEEPITRATLKSTCGAQAVTRLASGLLATRRSTLTVRVNVAGARVTVGPRFVGVTEDQDLALRDLLPGTHLVQVKRQGYRTFEERITLRPGEERVLNVALDPEGGTLAAATPADGAPGTPPPPPRGKLGWKVAFWTSAVATVGLAVGLGVSGAKVMSLEADKENLIREYRSRIRSEDALPKESSDICGNPQQSPGGDKLNESEVSRLNDICSDGKNMALTTNVLIGVTAGVAVLSGIFYYMAYISKEAPAPAPPVEAARSRRGSETSKVQWQVSPSLGPEGAGLGFQLAF